ncbi:MAG: hypothetical protein JNL75_11855 [Chitinophagales bacterium]|nr:hypothetical protein [Chitinophagales bacterium]
MSTVNELTKLNDVQLMLLKMFNRPLREQHIIDIRKLLLDYYDKMILEEVDRVIIEKGITDKDYEEFLEKT